MHRRYDNQNLRFRLFLSPDWSSSVRRESSVNNFSFEILSIATIFNLKHILEKEWS